MGGGATAANGQFIRGPATVEAGIAHARGIRNKRSHFAEENPMFEQGDGWMTGSVRDERAGTIDLVLGEPGAAAAGEQSQLEMRSI